jgi:hypothetical protein
MKYFGAVDMLGSGILLHCHAVEGGGNSLAGRESK